MYENEAKTSLGGALRGRGGLGPQSFDRDVQEELAAQAACQQNACNPERREPEISSAMNYSSRAIERLSDHVLQLNTRMQAIVRSVPPSPSADKASPSRQTELGQGIQNQADMIAHIDSVVQQILENLEI